VENTDQWKAIALDLAKRIACGCGPAEPCWTCQQVLKRFQAIRNEDQRVIQAIHRHTSDSPLR